MTRYQNLSRLPPALIDRVGQPKPEPPFRGPARIQAKKEGIPDDWEDDDGEDESQIQPIAPTQSQVEPDVPAESQGRGEKIGHPKYVHRGVSVWLL